MDAFSSLLGSSTRANLIGALARSEAPLSSYEVAKMCRMNVAKTYGEMKKLKDMGVVAAVAGRRGAEYRLVDEDLRRLALRLSPRVTTFEAWKGKKARKFRFRSGLLEVPRFSVERSEEEAGVKPSRLNGELRSLALLGRKRFDSKYRKTGKRSWSLTGA